MFTLMHAEPMVKQNSPLNSPLSEKPHLEMKAETTNQDPSTDPVFMNSNLSPKKLRQLHPELYALLDSYPLLSSEFSAVAKRNLSRRFHIDEWEINKILWSYRSPHQTLKGDKRRLADLIALLSVPSYVGKPTHGKSEVHCATCGKEVKGSHVHA